MNDLDKERYPTLCKMFEELERKDIYIEGNFDTTYPNGWAEIFNLKKESTARIVLNNETSIITKMNSHEFFDEEYVKKGLKISYDINKHKISARIKYDVYCDEDREYEFNKFLVNMQHNNLDLAYSDILGEYTENRFNELVNELSLEYMIIDFVEYEIAFYFYLKKDGCPRIWEENGTADIEYHWNGEFYAQKYRL